MYLLKEFWTPPPCPFSCALHILCFLHTGDRVLESTLGEGDRVSLGDQPWRRGQGEFVRQTMKASDRGPLQSPPLPWPPGFPSPIFLDPVLQGCLTKLPCPHSPRVASDLSYCNSQGRAMLDNQHSYRGMLVTGELYTIHNIFKTMLIFAHENQEGGVGFKTPLIGKSLFF